MAKVPRRVLFVCTGNICRSAMAEHLLRHLCAKGGLAVEARSCGTAAESYYRVPEVVHRLLTLEGVPAFKHQARLATREQLRWADLVLAMTADHAEELCSLYPEFSAKIQLFREDEEDVDDPMGLSDDVFRSCLATIRARLEALVLELQR